MTETMSGLRTKRTRAVGRGDTVGRAGVAALALLALVALPAAAQEPQSPTATEEAAPAGASPAAQDAAGPTAAEPATTGTTDRRPPAAGAEANAPAPPPADAPTAALEEAEEEPAATDEAAPADAAATTAAIGDEAAPEPPAQPVLSEEEVAARIAEAYGVEVLKVARDDLIGGPAYAVKVMRPGGDSNAAFRVSTLMVDGVTGELIPQFRHRNAGYQRSGAFRAEPGADAAGEELRLRTFRAGPEAIQ
jgi:hypothetical protein